MAGKTYSKASIAGIVALYFAVSISLVFVNKMLMSSPYSIPAPLFVTWFQCVVSVAIAWATGYMGQHSPTGSFWKMFPVYQYKPAVARQTVVMASIFVGMIAFNNLCLRFVEVSFYQVARSLTIVFNVVLTYFVLGESTSLPTIGSLVIVIAGFYLGSAGEVNFSLVGTVFGVISSLFVSLNAVATKRTLDVVDGNKFLLSAYTNTTASILFLPLIMIAGEVDIIQQHASLLFSPLFWGMMVLSGVFGFSIGIVCMLQIQATSPLTHNISGTAKACLQTVLALVYFGNPTTYQNLMGIAAVLAGSLLYAYIRLSEMPAKAPAKPPPSTVPASPDKLLSAMELGSRSPTSPPIRNRATSPEEQQGLLASDGIKR